MKATIEDDLNASVDFGPCNPPRIDIATGHNMESSL